MAVAMLSGAVGLAGCSGAEQGGTAPDAGADGLTYGLWSPEAAASESHAWDRLEPHAGRVLASARLVTVYVEDAEGPANADAAATAVIGGSYWGALTQYGVSAGAIVGSRRVDAGVFFRAGTLNAGLVSEADVEASVHALIHPAGGAGAWPVAVDGYVFFLPGGVNVVLASRGTHVDQTCTDVDGYHDFDGDEPYAVIPSCATGATAFALSHELAELATNPVPGLGWFSDADLGHGGEVADLCQEMPPALEGGQALAELWSNADGECVPR
jgi:hypothetical protein